MGTRISAFPAAAASAAYKLIFAVSNVLTRSITMGDFADWIIKTYAGFLPSGTGAISRPMQAKLREIEVSITDHGAVDGADIATAFANAQTALPNGGVIIIPEAATHWLLGSQLSTPDGTPYIIRGRGFASKIKKGFNGAMISLGARSRIEDLYLDGNGSNFTGRGVIVSTGSASDPTASRFIENCDILDTQSYGVEFTAAQAGYGSVIHNSRIIPTSTATPAVKFPADAGNTGNRTLSLVFTNSSEIADLGGANNTLLIGCQGAGPLFSGTAITTTITGCRIPQNAGASWTVKGTNTVISGCIISPGTIVFHSGMVNSKFKGNMLGVGTTITDNAPGASQNNEIDYDYATYTPAWTSSGVAPVLNNGVLTGNYSRRGQWARVKVSFTAGNTTTFGTGNYRFSLPYSSSAVITGTAFVQDVDGSFYGGVTAYIDNADNLIKLISSGAQTDFIGAAAPFTFASGDIIKTDIEYPIL